jgi:hypothetical protein
MSKTANNSVNWGTVAKAKSSSGSGGGIDFKELFLRPQAPKNEGEKNTYVVRFLENPHPYLVHWNRRTVNDKPKKVEFFDGSDDYRKINRNCFGSLGPEGEQVGTDTCIWCKQGYHKQLRYMVNVIDYTDKKNPRVRILDAPRSVLEAVANWVEAVYESEGEYIDPSSWDEEVPQFMITVERTSSAGGVNYSVSTSPKSRPLTEQELELIRDLNPDATTDDEALKLHEIERWIAPTKPRTDIHGNALAEEEKSSNYDDVDDEDEDDDKALASKKTASKPAPSQKPKPKPPVDEDEDEDDSDEDEDKADSDDDGEDSGDKEDWF